MKFIKKLFPAVLLSVALAGAAFAAANKAPAVANYKTGQTPGKAVTAVKSGSPQVYIQVVNNTLYQIYIMQPAYQPVNPNYTGYYSDPTNNPQYVVLSADNGASSFFQGWVCPYGILQVYYGANGFYALPSGC